MKKNLLGGILIGFLLCLLTAATMGSPFWDTLQTQYSFTRAQTVTALDPIELSTTLPVAGYHEILNSPTTKRIDFISRETSVDWFIQIGPGAGKTATTDGQQSIRLTPGAAFICSPCYTDRITAIHPGGAAEPLQLILYY